MDIMEPKTELKINLKKFIPLTNFEEKFKKNKKMK